SGLKIRVSVVRIRLWAPSFSQPVSSPVIFPQLRFVASESALALPHKRNQFALIPPIADSLCLVIPPS
ncbi:hypothetical protein, partial [Mesorhizobium sp.]|uniref:hypothetical protein n=1 Tax=Mesorhizobium sp. TaxID=1871066 RepID=UPI0025EDECC8